MASENFKDWLIDVHEVTIWIVSIIASCWCLFQQGVSTIHANAHLAYTCTFAPSVPQWLNQDSFELSEEEAYIKIRKTATIDPIFGSASFSHVSNAAVPAPLQ